MELASLETIDRGSRRGLWLIVGSSSTLPAISNLKSLASCLALTSIVAVLTRLACFSVGNRDVSSFRTFGLQQLCTRAAFHVQVLATRISVGVPYWTRAP